MLKALIYSGILWLAGCGLIGVGSASNDFVIRANAGQMPVWCVNDSVLLSVASDPAHSLLTRRAKYVALADVIPIAALLSRGIGIGSMASIGDLFIFAGSLFVVFSPFGLLLVILRQFLRI